MVEPVTIGISIMGIMTSVIGGAIISNKASKDPDWYDFFHYYFNYAEEFTDDIDQLLMDPVRGRISVRKQIAENRSIPDVGVHCYYCPMKDCEEKLKWYGYVGFRKIEVKLTDVIKYHYSSWFIPFDCGKNAHSMFQSILFNKNKSTSEIFVMKVMSIDMSRMDPQIVRLDKICHTPKENQQKALNYIENHYTLKHNYNVKVMICGFRGIGKTHTPMLLKSKMENDNPNHNVQLFDNFDPSAIGVNVSSLVLKRAKETSPVILVINEIDIAYEATITGREAFDPRTQHTKNKNTFNDMMDTIGSTPYVIAIFTTELSPKKLYETETYKSFMRPGRVDFFLNMEETKTTYIANDYAKIMAMPS